MLIYAASFLSVVGCDQLGGGNNADIPDPKPIEARPVAQELPFSGGELSVIVVKNGDTEVPGKFEGLSGQFRFADGARQQGFAGTLTVDLATWDSALAERDTVVREVLFGGEGRKTATVRIKSLDGVPEDGIALGQEIEVTAHTTVSIGPVNQELNPKLSIRRTGESGYHLDSIEPIVVSVEAFQLKDRMLDVIKRLDLKSVDDSVRVIVTLDLEPDSGHDAEPATAEAEAPPATTPPSIGPRPVPGRHGHGHVRPGERAAQLKKRFETRKEGAVPGDAKKP